MQATSFICEDCGDRIEDETHPVVTYIVAGLAPMHPVASGQKEADVTDYPMPQILRDLLAKSTARDEMCVACVCERLKHDLVDKNGVILAPWQKAREYLKSWKPPAPKAEEEASSDA